MSGRRQYSSADNKCNVIQSKNIILRNIFGDIITGTQLKA